MKVVQKQLAPSARPQERLTFSEAVNGDKLRNLIQNTLKDPQRSANFASTLISIVASDDKLKDCDPGSVVAAALRGEGMGLSLALDHYSIVAYGKTAAYQTGYKGFSQLATNSGYYIDFDAYDVREGEYKGRDPKTRRPIVEWIEDEDEREKLPVSGIYAFFELQNGFFKAIYWSYDKILNHADKYAQAFNRETYEKFISGELDKTDPKMAQKLRGKVSPWYAPPLSEEHLKMCKKTVLMQLLNSGKAPLSTQMREVVNNELAQERSDGVIYADDPVVLKANADTVNNARSVVESTATVSEADSSKDPAAAKAKQESPENNFEQEEFIRSNGNVSMPQ